MADLFKLLPLAFRFVHELPRIRRIMAIAAPIIQEFQKAAPELMPEIRALWRATFPDVAAAWGDAKPGELVSYDVRWLQEGLNKLGYKLTVDGDYGPATKEAVRKYQEANGLDPDGWAGVLTVASIAVKLRESGLG